MAAVATSPCMPPSNFSDSGGVPFDANRVVRLGRAQVRLHVQRDERAALPVADAVLHEPAHLPGSHHRGPPSTVASAIFGCTSSVILSSRHPIASAIIETDSARPTCRTRAGLDGRG